MAFKNMMNGDDSCGGSANPMAQMLKQFGQDRSLQRVSNEFVYRVKLFIKPAIGSICRTFPAERRTLIGK